MNYIDQQEELEDLCKSLEQEKIIGFDTEFIRETTFVPVLCLMQISTTKDIYVIDPLEIDISSLIKILTNPDILKIMHSSVQDIDVFYKNFEIIPKPIFDIQIAASFLGYGDSISYAKLVKKLTGAAICKESKLTNWQLRPLNEKQISYAANDVKYLHEMHETLLNKLEEEERLAWVDEEHENLYTLDSYYLDPELAWKRVSQNREIPFFLNYLKSFAKYREELAVQNDRPRRFIIRDEVLVRLAKLQPKHQEDLNKDRVLKKLLPKNLVSDLIYLSNEVRKEKEELVVPNKHKLSTSKELLSDLLKLYLKYVSQHYKIALKNIARTRDIDNFLNDEPVKFTSGWRNDVYGKVAAEIVAGKKMLVVEEGKLAIKDTP